MTLDDRVQALRLLVFRRAQVLGNVSAACRELNISRSLFYRLRPRSERYRPAGLHPRCTAGLVYGVASLPLGTPVELELIFEVS